MKGLMIFLCAASAALLALGTCLSLNLRTAPAGPADVAALEAAARSAGLHFDPGTAGVSMIAAAKRTWPLWTDPGDWEGVALARLSAREWDTEDKATWTWGAFTLVGDEAVVTRLSGGEARPD